MFKSYTSDEHVENIKDILVDYTDNNDFCLSVTISPLLLAKKNKELIDKNRTFYLTIWIDQKIARNLVPNDKKDKYDKYLLKDRFTGGYTSFPGLGIAIANRMTVLKKECISRLEKFGYRLYNDESTFYDISCSFTVTYRPNKFKF
jgi:hypothetical protein